MMKEKDVFSLIKDISKNSKTSESYHTGLLGEQMIVSAYKSMDLSKLEKLRFIMNKIIKQKKEFRRVEDSKNAEH